jgi:hypothetical protein
MVCAMRTNFLGESNGVNSDHILFLPLAFCGSKSYQRREGLTMLFSRRMALLNAIYVK